ncbi:hypothetical protein ACHOLT_12415 [Desulfitobacterium sp. Sab5]|uniref:hypothetical protein n=1 Tax=Desulfitobacterium nosdiversum TaxID=3375356 RepID=UPI003CE79E99
MKKIAILIMLYFLAYTFSPQLQTETKSLVQSKPVQEAVTQVSNYAADHGWSEIVQKMLGTTLQVVSGVSSDNPALEKSMRLLENHLQIRLHTLPPVNPSLKKEQASQTITLYAGDTGISDETLKSASSLITSDSLPIIQNNTNLNPKKETEVVLYSSPDLYGNALLKAGISSDEISAIVSQTGGITVDSAIWIPMYNLQGKDDLANVLTHELTHVTFNQAGIGTKLPLWLNEGVCWHNGLAAQEKVNSTRTNRIIKAMTANLKKTAQNGELLPLDQIDQSLLSASYNVEFQGYLATEQLIDKHGLDRFKAFLNQTQRQDVQRSFQQNFGQSLGEFEKEFTI